LKFYLSLNVEEVLSRKELQTPLRFLNFIQSILAKFEVRIDYKGAESLADYAECAEGPFWEWLKKNCKYADAFVNFN